MNKSQSESRDDVKGRQDFTPCVCAQMQHDESPTCQARKALVVRIRTGRANRRVPIEAFEAARTLDSTDKEAGWPPIFVGAKVVRVIEPSETGLRFTDEDQKHVIATALQNPEVIELLRGRSDVLGCHIIEDPPCRGIPGMHVYAFNYSTNDLIQVRVENFEVKAIARKEPWQHPESLREIADAISLAREHPHLKEAVRDLAAHGILQVPMTDPNAKSYRHRCIHVTFTDREDPTRELPARHHAYVDLALYEVISSHEDLATAESQLNNLCSL
jgi:hypothetical protein